MKQKTGQVKMRIEYSKNFTKQYNKLPTKIQKVTEKRIGIFVKNPQNQILRNHKLVGQYSGYRSIDITGDYRAIYCERDDGTIVIFAFIGTHSQLY